MKLIGLDHGGKINKFGRLQLTELLEVEKNDQAWTVIVLKVVT